MSYTHTTTATTTNFIHNLDITGSGSHNLSFQTTNHFVDKDITVLFAIPSAGGASVEIGNKAGTNITVGNASGGYYPLTTSLTATFNFNTLGFIDSSTFTAADNSVTVGRIAQSTATAAAITPTASTTQTVTIKAGYYHTDRTVQVGPMSAGTNAVATVAGTKAQPAPLLGNTSAPISGMVQVPLSTTTDTLTSAAGKYYVAMTATAQAVNITPTPNISTPGYLGAASQITGSVTASASSQLFYSIIPQGKITVSSSAVTTTPTLANKATSSSGTYIASNPTTTKPTSGYYYSVELTAPSTTLVNSVSVTTAGYVTTATEVIVNAATTTKTSQYYLPIASGALGAGAGNVTASATNMSFTTVNSQPSSGPYITIAGKGTVSVTATGYMEVGKSSSSLESNTQTKYLSLPTAQFVVDGGVVKTTADGAGWINASTPVGTVSNGKLTNSAQTGVTYTDISTTTNAPVLVSGDFLYINAGYFTNQKISLAKLVPDVASIVQGNSDSILPNVTVYDKDGNLITGSMAIYAGAYTLS